ncbi:intradiol ring-cleavage dioxygenase [Actinokineospora sp. NBRC 105648]|uniref:intradiol ring-cleavage dioxygenase n=1 Tax=Actinokineospora sp. NBRC 105648 TaxID=3032206 RepID=UPI0025553636|nr:intradiol ring-cleavage dioxygenase [Actinokineospora sp. NBRC 105648]
MTQIADHDRGLAFDLATLGRRRLLTLLGGTGLAVLTGCATADQTGSSPPGTSAAGTTTTGAAAACGEETPQETAGPYPGDGSNGPNVLTESGIVRGDIRSSFGTSSTTAKGVPLTIELTILDSGKGCAAMSGAAVYLWHCDIDGKYSLYSQGVTNENYLRGVQETDAQGKVTFTSIFPAAYSGRWPHIHFEVYPSLVEATKAGNPTKTTQLALPEDVCTKVYATDGYSQSVRNLARSSLDTDNVFSDGHDTQLAAVAGSTSGYTASLTVRV